MTARRRRGADTQRHAAAYAAANGWPYAQANGSGAPGRDILGMPGLAPEVKARREFSLTGSLKQAVRNGKGDLAFVICRPDGYGPERIADWPVVLRYADWLGVLRAAGYGDPEEKETGPMTDPDAAVKKCQHRENISPASADYRTWWCADCDVEFEISMDE